MIVKLSYTLLFLATLVGTLFALNPVTTFAQNERINTDCVIEQKEIKWWNIGTPGEFTPIVPSECSVDGQGRARALSPALLPDVIIRVYGFLVSLMFLLILPVVVYAGFLYMWGGINESGVASSKRLLQNSFTALIVVSLFYTIINFIFSIIGFNGSATDVSQFFTF